MDERGNGRRILVVDDETSMRHMLRLVLEREGYQVDEAQDGAAGLAILRENSFQYVLCDIRMPGLDGLGFLRQAVLQNPDSTYVMMSAYGTIDTAIQCMKEGAYDYVAKPFKVDEIVLTLAKAEERQRLVSENAALRQEIRTLGKNYQMVYGSETMKKVMELVVQVAKGRAPVLIAGETGTGKELVARALHEQGPRKKGPFVAVNCSAFSPGLLESELFGHARGAFTGAERTRHGLFAAADGGTLFLDEIGELPLDFQPKLLRVVQEGEFRRVGETQPAKVDVRILTATARDLKAEVDAGRFREDLYYRLAVVEIRTPPLRERREDIPLLARYFIDRIAAREGRPAPEFSAEALSILKNYDWPGNVRELENLMEKTMIFCRGTEISLAGFPWEVRRHSRNSSGDISLRKANRRLEEEYIRKALAATGGNRTQAARLLEISLRGLLYKIKEFKIE
jgi:DNA-binding NtrC family response regulator